MINQIVNREIKRFENGEFHIVSDLIVTEEPLEIRIGYGPQDKRQQKNIAVTMRTPGNDENLTLGFLFTEGIIDSSIDVLSIKPCIDKKTNELNENIIRVELRPDKQVDVKSLERNFYTTSSCGVCGKASIEMIEQQCKLEIPNRFTIDHEFILGLTKELKSDQLVFNHTGGLHATALFSKNGKLLSIKEDVGRHNAFDKVVGEQLLKNQLPLFENIALVSGRLSFELVQKAAMVGIPIICAIGAPSSLAIQTAEKFNISLIGFLKAKRYNIYTHPERIVEKS